MQLLGLLHLVGQDPQHDGQDPAFPVNARQADTLSQLICKEKVGDYHADACCRDQAGGSGTQTIEGLVDVAVVTEAFQESGNDQNHDDRGCNQSQGGSDRTEDGPGHAIGTHTSHIAYVGGHVDTDGARGGLTHRDHVGQIVVGKPAGGIGHLIQEGNGGHASAYRKEARLKELVKQTKIQHHLASPPVRSSFFFVSMVLSRMPTMAAATTNTTGVTSRK